jgi:hypothetical protein
MGEIIPRPPVFSLETGQYQIMVFTGPRCGIMHLDVSVFGVDAYSQPAYPTRRQEAKSWNRGAA